MGQALGRAFETPGSPAGELLFECCTPRQKCASSRLTDPAPLAIGPPPVLKSQSSLDTLLDSPGTAALADGDVSPTDFDVAVATSGIPSVRPVLTLTAKDASLDSKLKDEPLAPASPTSPVSPGSPISFSGESGGRASPGAARSPMPKRISWAPPMAGGSPPPERVCRRKPTAAERAAERKGLTVMELLEAQKAASKSATRVQC